MFSVQFRWFALASFALLGGCPVYGDSTSRRSSTSGYAGSAPDGDDPCSSSLDCPTNYTCGKDQRCHTGDCTFSGCVTGETCVKRGGYAFCEPESEPSAGGSSAAGGHAGGSPGQGGALGPGGNAAGQGGAGGG